MSGPVVAPAAVDVSVSGLASGVVATMSGLATAAVAAVSGSGLLAVGVVDDGSSGPTIGPPRVLGVPPGGVVPAEVHVPSSVLSPGPSYDGKREDVDPYFMRWPLNECPDWPISNSWRDFAFEEVVLRPRHFSPRPPGSLADESFP